MFYTYIIESEVNKTWYYGHCSDLNRRISEHNGGQNKSTKRKGPWKLIFVREFDTKLEASRFELKLKKTRNKLYISTTYNQYFIGA